MKRPPHRPVTLAATLTVAAFAALNATPALATGVQAGALAAGPSSSSDLSFTVVSTTQVYSPGDGSSVVFATVRNDSGTTLSLANSFAVTFFDSSGNALGTVSAAGGGLSSALRAVPPGQIGDVSARLPAVQASTARVTNDAAAGSPYSDPRLSLAAVPNRSVASANADTVTATVVNTGSYPDLVHLVVLAEDADDDLLGALTMVPPGDLPSGSSTTVTATYVRLPGEPVADHYDVLAEGLPDGAAASSLTAPSTSDTPTSGLPVTLTARLLDGDGVAISGAQVELTDRRPGKPLATLTRGRTDSRGRVSLRAIPPAIGQLQLVFTGDATHAPVSTGDFAFRLHARLTIGTVVASGSLTVRGQLPDYPGERVTLQELVHNRWRTVKTVATDRSGGVRYSLRPNPGPHTYRLSVPATVNHLAAVSTRVIVQL